MADQAPNPADSYERAHPENEAGMGRLDNNRAIPTNRPDQMESAVKHRQDPRQINAEPDHSMNDEEPLDEGPVDIHDPRKQRHPRREGRGGTP